MRHSPYRQAAFLILFWLVLSISPGVAQRVVQGRIQTVGDGAAVSYALVTDPQHRFGTYAGVDGRFTARIPAGVDTLLVSCVGFHDTTALLADLTGDIQLQMRPKATQLAEVTVRRRGKKAKVATLGALRRRVSFVWGNCSGRNIEYALLLRNARGQTGYLQKVSYFIDKEGAPTAPFRVRVYANVDNEPGPDLLPRSVIASARRGNSWVEIDLTQFGIRLPREGVFVAMEWLATQDQKFYFSKGFKMPDGQNNALECYGQYLGFAKEIRSPLVWERVNGGFWRRHNSAFSRVGGGEHPIIQAKMVVGN